MLSALTNSAMAPRGRSYSFSSSIPSMSMPDDDCSADFSSLWWMDGVATGVGTASVGDDDNCNENEENQPKRSFSWNVFASDKDKDNRNNTSPSSSQSTTTTTNNKNKRRSLGSSMNHVKHNKSIIGADLTTAAGGNHDGTSNTPINPYKMLQIRKDATQSEVKQAYRRHALWHHPGRQSALPEAEFERRKRIFTLLAACCETLLERESRARLDVILKGPPTQASLPKAIHNIRSRQQRAYRSANEIPVMDLSYTSDSSSDDDNDDENDTGPDDHNDDHNALGTNAWCQSQWPCSMTPITITGNATTPRRRRRANTCAMITNGNSFEHQPTTIRNNRRYMRSMSSCSTDEQDHIHYTQKETDRLFGGPLALLYRARMFRPFSDPFVVFDRVFGSAVFPTTGANNHSEASDCTTPVRNSHSNNNNNHQTQPHTRPIPPPLPRSASASSCTTTTNSHSNHHSSTATTATNLAQKARSAAWTGTFETLPDGSTVYTTCRVLHGRKLVKRETITIDPTTGKQKSTITVTSEELPSSPTKDGKRKDGKRNKNQSNAAVGDDGSIAVPSGNDIRFLDCVVWYMDCCSPMDLWNACDFATEDYFGFVHNLRRSRSSADSDSAVVDNSSTCKEGTEQLPSPLRNDTRHRNSSKGAAIRVY